MAKNTPAPAEQTAPAIETTAVATQAPAGAVALPPDMASMLYEDAGSGLEKITKDDIAIPRLALLQALSEQCKKSSSEYLPEAKPGDFFDAVSGKLFPGDIGIDLVFISFRATYIEFLNRKDGGGFIADHGENPAILNECDRGDKGEYIPRDRPKNEIVPTKEYFAFLVDKETGDHQPILVSLSKSQAKYGARLNTMLTQRRITLPDPKNPGQTVKVPAPMFYQSWHATTVVETNKNGDEWMSWHLEPAADVLSLPFGQELYLAARAYKLKVEKGEVKVSEPQAPTGEAQGDEGGKSPF